MFEEKKDETPENENQAVAEQSGAPEEKVRRIAIGATVAGVLLILFLVIVLIILLVQVGVKNSERRKLDALIAEQSQLLEGEKADLDALVSGNKMYWEALNYGYKYNKE